jgi:hypothetical protein
MFNRMTYADWSLLMEGMEARKLWVTVNDRTLESEMDRTSMEFLPRYVPSEML